MKIAILNGNPDGADQALDRYLVELKGVLSDAGHDVTLLMLHDMDIKYCTGCFGCWLKTPGECVARDDSAVVCRQMINSGFVLWASPIIMGFASALLKKMVDKTIPLVHPYFAMVQGEYHHRARYKRYPLFGALWEKRGDTDDRDIDIVNDIFSRTALNFKSRLALTCLTSDPVAEVADEINRL
jgi:multimeric flavodoxin WrbA